MTIFEQINMVPVKDILLTLGVAFRPYQNILHLFEGGKETSGWKADPNKGMFHDFSGKGRAEGDRITFVMSYTGKTKGEVVSWFEKTFSLDGTDKYSNIEQPKEIMTTEILEEFSSYSECNQQQIDYIQSRGINYEKVKSVVKNYGGAISCLLYNEKMHPISIIHRTIDKKSFKIKPGTRSSDACYTGGSIDKNNKKIYVCEGMFDFLTLYQYTKNVISQKSAGEGISLIRNLHAAGYEIIVIPDADEAGKKIIEKLSDIPISIYDIGEISGGEAKDLNQLFLDNEIGDSLLEYIEEDRSRIPSSIDNAYDELLVMRQKYLDRGIYGLSTYPVFDRVINGFIEGCTYGLSGFSNTGKTQFSYYLANKFIKKGLKVSYISLETSPWNTLLGLGRIFYNETRNNILSGKSNSFNKENLINDFKNVLIPKNLSTWEKIKNHIIESNSKVVFIDYFQAINYNGGGSSEVEKYTSLALSLQEIAIERNIVIIYLSQIANSGMSSPKDAMPKGSGGIFASLEGLIHLYKDQSNGKLMMIIRKNKNGPAGGEFYINTTFGADEYPLMDITAEPFSNANY